MRFYFNVYDEKDLLDDEGVEFESTEGAREAAVKLAGAILQDDAAKIARGCDWRLEVTDPTGITLFHLDVNLQASAAVTELPQRQARRA